MLMVKCIGCEIHWFYFLTGCTGLTGFWVNGYPVHPVNPVQY